ncbi:MAG: hypothetical protein Q4F60_02320, partial [Candidatus Saccharibacteria bacterium]|nr:hypothetical protein [Candidatus Saccharibacteria bacterium]
MSAPQNFEEFSDGQSIDFYFGRTQNISRIMFYSGETPGNYKVYYFEDTSDTTIENPDEGLDDSEVKTKSSDDSSESNENIYL